MFKEVVESINPTLQCKTATNGKIALVKLKVSTSLPYIIFPDLNKPVMNGFEFLIQLKKENAFSKIRICIFTISNTLHDEELTRELGAQFFLIKPNDFKVLCAKLRQVMIADITIVEYLSIT